MESTSYTWRQARFQEDVKNRLLGLPAIERLKLGIKYSVPGVKIPLDDEPMPAEDWVMPLLIKLRDAEKLKELEQDIFDVEHRLGMR